MKKRESKSREYQGHHCRNCWNVALWIGNDEGLYRAALECKRRPMQNGNAPSVNVAASRFLRVVYGEKTPDGARYTRAAVKAALAGLE